MNGIASHRFKAWLSIRRISEAALPLHWWRVLRIMLANVMHAAYMSTPQPQMIVAGVFMKPPVITWDTSCLGIMKKNLME